MQCGNDVLVSRAAVMKDHKLGGWEQQMFIVPHAVLEARSLKTSCWWGYTPSETFRGNCPFIFAASGGLLISFDIPWLAAAYLHHQPSLSHDGLPCVFTCPTSRKDANHFRLRRTHRQLITSAMTLVSNKVTFWVTEN